MPRALRRRVYTGEGVAGVRGRRVEGISVERGQLTRASGFPNEFFTARGASAGGAGRRRGWGRGTRFHSSARSGAPRSREITGAGPGAGGRGVRAPPRDDGPSPPPTRFNETKG